MERATPSDQSYFLRVARNNLELAAEKPPGSLVEMFDRLDSIRTQAGSLAEPGQTSTEEGDLKSHLEYLKRLRSFDYPYGT